MPEKPDPSQPHVVAVVVTWNDTRMATDCVGSVLASDYENLRVVLVDNGSDTPCGEQVKVAHPGIDLLTLPENRGFTGGSNHGIEHALSLGADYVHLIGNDSTIAPDAISCLVRELEARPRVGGASPLLFHPGQERVIQFYTGSVDRNLAKHVHQHENEPYENRSWPTVETDFVPFVAVMFRAEALREAGGFDESLGTCWEDYDLILRFEDHQWGFITVGDSEVVHLGRATTGHLSPYITYYMVRNRLICLFRYGSKLGILGKSIPIVRSFWRQVRNYGLTNWGCHRAFARGVLHFVLGIRGEGHAPRDRRG